MIRCFPWLLLVALAAIPVRVLPAASLCGFKAITGLPCPLCGMTHALVYGMHGNWPEALHWHLLSPVVFFLLLLYPFLAASKQLQTNAYLFKLAVLFGAYGVFRWCAIVLVRA